MKGILAVVGLTGAVFVSGFAYSPGTDKAASESLYGEVMMPGEWTPAVGCYSAKPRLDFILDYKAYHSHRLLRPELVDWSRR